MLIPRALLLIPRAKEPFQLVSFDTCTDLRHDTWHSPQRDQALGGHGAGPGGSISITSGAGVAGVAGVAGAGGWGQANRKRDWWGGERVMGGVLPSINIGTWGPCDRLCLVLVCRGRWGLGGRFFSSFWERVWAE